MLLSEIIRRYREEHCLSASAFAKQCGVSRGYISLVERGVNSRGDTPVKPSYATLEKLARGMNIAVSQLSAMLKGQEDDITSHSDTSHESHLDVTLSPSNDLKSIVEAAVSEAFLLNARAHTRTHIDEKEAELLRLFRLLPDSQKDIVANLITSLLQQGQPVQKKGDVFEKEA